MEPPLRHNTQTLDPTSRPPPADHELWDCGSSLYDSFELLSFQRQLDSALSSSGRTISMPRLPPDTHADYVTLHAPSNNRKPAGSKISRSLHKLVRSVFRKSRDASSASYRFFEEHAKDMNRSREGRYVFVYDKSGALSTIPEAPESEHGGGAMSPEHNPFARKTRSERFTASKSSLYSHPFMCLSLDEKSYV